MITRHFLATVSGDCKFMRTRVHFDINHEGFSISGRKVIDPGFTAIQRSGEMEDVVIPDFAKGETVEIKKVSMGSHKTRAPPYLSESDLLSLMEKHGIGTDASMATHINNICERNYVKLAEGRRLIPTQLGIALVHGYQMVDNELVIPKVRANMEYNCTLVAEGKAEILPVVQHCLRLFREKFIYYESWQQNTSLLSSTVHCISTADCSRFCLSLTSQVKNVDLVDQLFETIFKSLEADQADRTDQTGTCLDSMLLAASAGSRKTTFKMWRLSEAGERFGGLAWRHAPSSFTFCCVPGICQWLIESQCECFARRNLVKTLRFYCSLDECFSCLSAFWFPRCNRIFKMPQNGQMKLYKELKCPLDNFELLV